MSPIFSTSLKLLFASPTGTYLLILLPIAVPLMFIYIWWVFRYRWLTMKFVEAQKTCLLEIKLPKEILKSPAGMEIFFSYFAQSGAPNYGEAFIDGKTKPWFSCELVSIGGEVKFFIWCSQAKFKQTIESQLYAQYPNIEVHEIAPEDDYTNKFYFDIGTYPMYALQYGKNKKKSDTYPIKTYIDFGLNEDPKDEYKIDPLTSVLEFLGSIRKGENLWIQILIQKHEKEDWKHGTLAKDVRDLKNEIKAEIEKVRAEAIPKAKKGDEETFKFPNPTKGQNEIIATIERNASKTPLDCMMRGIYIAEKSVFNQANIGGLIGCFRQYSSNSLNSIGLGLNSDVSDTRKDFARILPFLKKKNEEERDHMREDLLHAYKLRSYFQLPYKHYTHGSKPFIMTTEELASIFHFPSGLVSQTPTLARVGSKKSEAPANLPI
jgi:hypothetical protein